MFSNPTPSKRLNLRWSVLSILAVLTANPVLAADPFRTGSDARPMGPALESAFKDFFQTGLYQNSTQKLVQAQVENPDEPLVYVLQAALAYQNRQKEQFLATIPKIRTAAKALEFKDVARSHLYHGVAQGLEGYFLKDNLADLPKAVNYMSSMLLEINRAHQLAPNDPEVNLFVGFVDTVLQKHDKALTEFSKAGPTYLAHRGLALVYRDTKKYPQAQESVEKALESAPQNPDLLYLKAQILALQGNSKEAVALFDQALTLGTQLPESVRKQITKERDKQIARLPTPK